MKPLQKVYKMIDPALTLKCQDVLDSIDRDITEFTARGFTPLKKTEFENAITAFDTMPTDNYLLGQQEIATQTKNNTRTLCETKINVVLTAVENVWGLDSSEYHLFTEDESLSKLTDTELLRYIEDVADSTEDELTALAGEGIDAATVTALRGLRTDFNDALKDQRKAIKARNTGDHARIVKGNALNKLLVSYCNTGKNIWINVDESKYNDYVIYDTASGNAAQVITLNVIAANSAVVDTTGITFAPGTPIKIEVLAGLFKTWFATNAGDIPLVPFAVTDNGEVAFLVASDIGFGPSRMILKVQNDSMVNGTIKITIG